MATPITTPESEKKLIAQLLSGDSTAVKSFFDLYSPMLFAFIRARVNDECDVEEIAQDSLFAFLDGVRDFNNKCKLSTYLCAIASHKVVDFYRKKKLKKIVFSQLPAGFELLLASAYDPDSALNHGFIKEKIKKVFVSLSPTYAKMLKLKYEEGRSVEEIARILSVSFKSAESILFRARRAFVKLYTSPSS